MSAEPAAHDPRLDESGDEHPGVQRGPFDLIALENTRLGLKVLGAGLAASMAGTPLLARPLGEWATSAGWTLHCLGLLLVAAAILTCAPTPNGPLPRWSRKPYATLLVLAGVGMLPWFRPTLQPLALQASWILLLPLPWILWRFCQHRGLTGRALGWLWIAMAATAAAALAAAGQLWGTGVLLPLALATSLAALQTSRALWLDAIYRADAAKRRPTPA